MGSCVSKKQIQIKSDIKTEKKKIKIVINCPICEENYDTLERKPYIICLNQHKLCLKCFNSMKQHSYLKKISDIHCPYCKEPIRDNIAETDIGLYKFLEAEKCTLLKLPENRKKLFAFSSIYLPSLHEFLKQQQKNQNNIHRLQNLDVLRIKGRMLEEYQVFQMEIFQCLPSLRQLYLRNNRIKAIDVNGYTLKRLQLIDLSGNKITAAKQMLTDASDQFQYLKVLNLSISSLIYKKTISNHQMEFKDINTYKLLIQVILTIYLGYNKLTTLNCFRKCEQLKLLNVEFNEVTENITYFEDFCQLQSLMIYGNNINNNSWENLLKIAWINLKILTLSVLASNLLQKYEIHNKIRHLSVPLLKLIVFQMVGLQPENINQAVEQSINNQTRMDKIRTIQISAETYEFYMQNKSFLKDIMGTILKQSPYGQNINFRAKNYNRRVYSENNSGTGYLKLKQSGDPADYLYSQIVDMTKKDKTFMAVIATNPKILIGICSLKKTIELDFQTMMINGPEGTKQCNSSIKMVRMNEVILCLDTKEQKKVIFYLQKKIIGEYGLPENWSKYQFYVNVSDKQGELTINREYYDMIL